MGLLSVLPEYLSDVELWVTRIFVSPSIIIPQTASLIY